MLYLHLHSIDDTLRPSKAVLKVAELDLKCDTERVVSGKLKLFT